MAIFYDSLTAALEPQVNAVRVTLTYHWTGSGNAHVDLILVRRSPSGSEAQVRGSGLVADLTTTAPQTFILRDFEAPIGVPISYRAQDRQGGFTLGTGATITIPDRGCDDTWLTDLARPTNTQQVVLESLDDLGYEVPSAVHDVLDRRDPIVTSDVANTPTFELGFLTESDDERERARATLGNGVPVLLRTPPANGIGNLYLAVTGWHEQRIVKSARVQDRRFVAACVQITRPDPTLYLPIGPSTYAHVKAAFATYADLKAGRVNYDAVLYDWSGSEPADVVPWPPDDV